MRELAGTAVDAADGLDRVGSAARGASQQAISSAQGFGAILDSWRLLGPEANAEVDRFIENMNAMPQLSFSAFRTRLAIFTKDMENRFGSVADAARDAGREVDDFEDRSGGFQSGGTTTLRREIDLTFNVKRDDQGPLVLSEADLNAIVQRVLEAINVDQARAGP